LVAITGNLFCKGLGFSVLEYRLSYEGMAEEDDKCVLQRTTRNMII
jgi:hypothetical protein